MKVIYVAHTLSLGDREENRRLAAEWCGWIARTFKVAISADWIILTGQWDESLRELGIATDLEMVSRADELWMVGDVASDGMLVEARRALALGKPVRDFVGLTRERIAAEYAAITDEEARAA